MPSPSPFLALCACVLTVAARTELPDLPDPLGRGGMAAVTVLDARDREAVLAVGGSNFPGKPPWEGGLKKFHGDILLLSAIGGRWAWQKVGELPVPTAYAVFAATSDRRAMILAGGVNTDGHLRRCWRIETDGQVTELPGLPGPRAYAGHAVHRGELIVLGGSEKPDAEQSNLGWLRLDLSHAERGWQSLPGASPQGILPLCGSIGSELFYGSGCLLGSAEGKPVRSYRNEVFRGELGRTMTSARLTRPVAAAAGPGVAVGGTLFFIGGDDGHHYPKPVQDHPGLSRDILAVNELRAEVIGQWPHRVGTAPLLRLGDDLVTVGGEDRPGSRTAKVTAWPIPDRYR